MSSGRLRLRLLGPAIALIAAATMIPTGLRHPSLTYIDNQIQLDDIVNNLILYLPLGFALAGSSLLRAFLYGLCLSTIAEGLQLGYVDRMPSLVDIASNTAGAVLGYVAAMVLLRLTGHTLKSLSFPRWLALAAIPVAVLGTISLLVHHPHPDFSNWDKECRLLVGNELTGDRRWAGTVTALQIYPFAMAPAQVDELANVAAASAPGGRTPLPDGGLVPPEDWASGGGHPVLSNQQEHALYDALVKQGRMTLLVWMRPDNLEQAGPARIVTYSQNAYSRNFTLGQVRNGLTFRLRTPMTGPNGTEPALFSGPVLEPNHTTFVAAVYDGRISRLYVDGKLAAHADLSRKRPHLPKHVLMLLPPMIPIRVIELGGAEVLCSSLLAIGLFAFRGVPDGVGMRVLVGLGAGLAVGVTIWAFAVSDRGLGMRILVECIAAGLVIAASVEAAEPHRGLRPD